MVRSDGSVFWSRNGRIDVNCRYTGLVAFPFDSLKCSFEIGGWAMSGIHQGLRFSGEGYSLEQGQATAGESYSEYSIAKIESELQTYFYATVPGEPYTVLRYGITLKRSIMYYWFFVVIPCLFITCASFTVFWVDPDVGERLGFSITLCKRTQTSRPPREQIGKGR